MAEAGLHGQGRGCGFYLVSHRVAGKIQGDLRKSPLQGWVHVPHRTMRRRLRKKAAAGEDGGKVKV